MSPREQVEYVDIKRQPRDFPGGPAVKNLPCSAEDTCSIPGQKTKLPRALAQLSPYAATPEPTHHS